MKTVFLIASLSYTSLLVSCSPEKSVASVYMSKQAASSDDSNPSTDGVEVPEDDPVASDDGVPTGVPASPSPPATTPPAPSPPATTPPAPAAGGDAAKGTALIKSTCSNCHFPGGPGKAALTTAYIARLDTAYTGQHKANHQGYADAFTNPGRLDLEAALKLVP